MTERYSDFYGLEGDNFNIETVCPYYLPESQYVFTWYRDFDGIAIVSGYDPKDDPGAHWLCNCGEFVTDGSCHCSCCKAEAPWGCDCGFLDEDEEDMDFGYDPYEESIWI